MSAKKRKPSKYKIGDVWMVRKLPLLTFVYTDMGWLVTQRGLAGDLWLSEHAERVGVKVYKKDKPPPGARRLV